MATKSPETSPKTRFMSRILRQLGGLSLLGGLGAVAGGAYELVQSHIDLPIIDGSPDHHFNPNAMTIGAGATLASCALVVLASWADHISEDERLATQYRLDRPPIR